ncbi:phage tail family protein [Thermoactinomyces daqus]|uniref:Phage tail family protein n=1 Tax=Thermoactinomyces daqus TaxID=1329516 RepID=A0A7W1XCA3_9BACL|nr:phage tail domain-containing protein [Thermoactinomyces daqus]MBA4544000.1 phage tail family protein [Thermoactinomyces daqus]
MARERITWVDQSGVETVLSYQPGVENTILLLYDREGFEMPSFSFAEEKIPLQSGSVLQDIQVEPREVDMAVMFRGNNSADLQRNVRWFKKLFNPLRGDGKLRVLTADGVERELVCRYKSGMEGREKTGESGDRYKKMVLTFRAFDPFFYSTQVFTNTYELNTNPPKWFPLFPLRLGGDAISTEIQLDNQGDIETFPVWTIYGPGQNPVLLNLTTGYYLMFENLSLDVNEFVTIDTQKRIIEKDDGTNLYPELSIGSTLWRLNAGVNIVHMEMDGASSDSKIVVWYRERYLGV